MNLKHLTDNQLLKDTASLAQREREISTKILHHLKEIEKRKLYSDLKCSSLYDYCTRILGFSEGSAQRRIQSARLLADLPEIEEKIEDGNLTMMNLAQAASFFKHHEIEAPEEKIEVLKQIENMSKRDCEKKLFEISGTEIPVKEIKKRVGKDKTKVSMVLSDETLEKISKLEGLIGKKLTREELISFMVDAAIKKVEKEKFKTEAKNSTPPPPVEVTSRYVRSGIKGEVYKRDQSCTQCGSYHHLNYDHRVAFATGGENSAENIRLLCFHCNQRARIRARL